MASVTFHERTEVYRKAEKGLHSRGVGLLSISRLGEGDGLEGRLTGLVYPVSPLEELVSEVLRLLEPQEGLLEVQAYIMLVAQVEDCRYSESERCLISARKYVIEYTDGGTPDRLE